MAQFLVLHTFDPKRGASDLQMPFLKGVVGAFTKDTYCVTTFMAIGAGKSACIWEAPSEQAIIDVIAKGPDMPVDGIYPATVIDWAELKKTLA